MNSLEKLISNLSTHWGIEPEKVVDRLNNMNESELKEIVNKMTKKYKTGGILDCLAKGGSLPECGCGAKMVKKGKDGMATDGDWDDYHTVINAPGDTLRFKQYFSGPVEMRTIPGKGIKYSRTVGNYKQNWHSPGYKSGLLEKLWMMLNGYTEVPESEVENWNELIYNHRNDPAVKDKTQKKEMGGELKKNDSKAGDSKKLVNHKKEWSKTQKMETPPKDKKKTFVKLEHLKNVQNTKPIKPLNYKK